MPKIVSGPPWTVDGRWVVIGQIMEGAPEGIIFDPDEGDPWTDLHCCIDFKKACEE